MQTVTTAPLITRVNNPFANINVKFIDEKLIGANTH
jgi:hypothetical protein